MIRTLAGAAALALIAGAAVAESTKETTIILQPETAGEAATPVAAGEAIAPIREGAASKAGGSGCNWGARTAYIGS